MTGTGPLPSSTIRRLRAVGAVLLSIALLGLGAVLLTPGRGAAVSLTGGTADHIVTLTVTPARTGSADVGIRLEPRRTGAGAATPVVTLQAVLPTAGHATPMTSAVPEGGGRYRASAVHLMMPGRWTFLVGIDHGSRHEQFDFPVTVGG